MPRIQTGMIVSGPYSADAKSAGKRSLGNAALNMITRFDGGAAAQLQFETATNMTMQLAALGSLMMIGKGDDASAQFRTQWRDDRLVMDKWFGLTVGRATPKDAAATALRLTKEPDFDITNPNRFRAVFGALSGNTAGFHDASGVSYRLMGEWLAKLDKINPQTTARMTKTFETWRHYDADRQSQICEVLKALGSIPNISRDTSEMVERILGN